MTWTKSAIREARKAELRPILLQQGYRLQPGHNGNYTVLPALPASPEHLGGGGSGAEGPDPDDPARPAGLLVKANYWIWADRDLAGNTIDFFVQVEGKTFHQAMQIITGASPYNPSEHNLRQEPGNVSKNLR